MSPRACVRVYARVLVPPNLYIHTYITEIEGEARIAQPRSIDRWMDGWKEGKIVGHCVYQICSRKLP